MEIHSKVIPFKKQRYNTHGDYFMNGKIWEYRISDMKNEDYHFAILLHELVESYLCKKRGVDWKKIDKFDQEFEKNRKPGDLSEPGDDKKNSPYYFEHQFATFIERKFLEEIGIHWKTYSDFVDNL